MKFSFIIFLGMVWLAAVGRAEVKPAWVAQRLPMTAAILERKEVSHFGFYQGAERHKIGWARDSLRPEIVEGRSLLTFESYAEFVSANEGQTVTSKVREKYFFDAAAPHGLFMATYLESSNGFTKSLRLRRDQDADQDYTATITEAGEMRKQPWAGLDFTLSDYFSCDVWAADPARQAGDQLTLLAINLEELETYYDVYTVKEIRSVEENGKSVRRLMVDLYDTQEDYHSDYELDERGQLVRAVVADAMEVVREAEAVAKKIDEVRDLFADSLAKADKDLGDVTRLTELEIELHGKNVGGISPTSWQSVEDNADGTVATVRIGKKFGKPLVATEEEIAEAGESTAILDWDNEAVRALAARAVKKARTPEAKVRHILRFVDRYIEDDYGAEPLTLKDLIKTKRGDCTEHALLFTALCRASGIPCREATGLMYDESNKAFGGHAWNEVVLDGHWHPVDPTWAEFEINAAHVQLSTGDSGMKDARFLAGGLSIKVLRMQ